MLTKYWDKNTVDSAYIIQPSIQEEPILHNINNYTKCKFIYTELLNSWSKSAPNKVPPASMIKLLLESDKCDIELCTHSKIKNIALRKKYINSMGNDTTYNLLNNSIEDKDRDIITSSSWEFYIDTHNCVKEAYRSLHNKCKLHKNLCIKKCAI